MYSYNTKQNVYIVFTAYGVFYGKNLESSMDHLIKALAQLPPILKGFRKESGLSQADMAEKLGITQQSYAYFESNPVKAPLERVFLVLRLLGVDLVLSQSTPVVRKAPAATFAKVSGQRRKEVAVSVEKTKPTVTNKLVRGVTPRKKEAW